MSTKEDIATYALYQLGGANGTVHIEDIAKKCHILAPTQFSWQLERYKMYPDIKATYYALDTASRAKGGTLVRKISDRSKGGQRFQLTQAGVQWIKKNKERLAVEFNVSGKDREKAQRDVQQFLRLLKARDNAFKRYKESGENIDMSIYEFIDFLGCSLETSKTEVRRKFAEMQMKAKSAEDTEIEGFLVVAKEKFPQLRLT